MEDCIRLDQGVQVFVEDVILLPRAARVVGIRRTDYRDQIEGGREATAGGGVGDLWGREGGREGGGKDSTKDTVHGL